MQKERNKTMYSIVLKDGKTINVNANEAQWFSESRVVVLNYYRYCVARFNMDNIAGFVDVDYKEKNCDVLDDMKDEIMTMAGDIETIADVLRIIDKYKAEKEH